LLDLKILFMKITDHYLVHIPETHEKELSYGSLKLEKVVFSHRIESVDSHEKASHIPDEHITKHGEVIHECTHVSKSLRVFDESELESENDFQRAFNRSLIEKNKSYGSDIELQKGDIAHFYHTAPNFNEDFSEIGKRCYRIHIRSVFAYERNGNLKVTRGHLLIEPIKKEKKSKSGLWLPESELTFNQRTGTHEWGQVKEHEENKGNVVLSHEDSEIKENMSIVFKPSADYPITINGKQYFVVKETDVVCCFNGKESLENLVLDY
jgi:co-chaperonin GroES (HSP10)